MLIQLLKCNLCSHNRCYLRIDLKIFNSKRLLLEPKSLVVVVEIYKMYANLLYVLFFGVNIL